MIAEWMSRTNLLLGEENIQKLNRSNVLVVGLGGVGGICAEMIARAGVGRMTIVDADVVEASNRNRQIPALVSTEQKLKTEVLAQRLLDINPDIDLKVLTTFVKTTETDNILSEGRYDYVADCIDTLSPKVHLMKTCYERKIPLVSSMGAGGRVNPQNVQVADISKTYNCLLAYYVRKKLHQKGIYTGIETVFSNEQPDKSKIVLTPDGSVKKSVIGTISYMPAIFGCVCASVVIRNLYSR
jgi:tRNA A37 threonylcarbamoyladenosine dehydratase